MSAEPFRFKKFIVKQDKSAMKIGTDGVLLGAWASLADEPESILDIGTGTGLIALMLAQRCEAEQIDAIELEPEAFEQAVDNFENSPWGDRLYCYHTSLQEFTKEIDVTYDLIVSNPPYFLPNPQADQKRSIARHHSHLSHEELIRCSAKLLSKNGSCAFILPHPEEQQILRYGKQYNLFPARITRVKGHAESPVKRSLIGLKFGEQVCIEDELILETERNTYTPAFREMVRDFYLKL
ncbi:MAG: methyltransferase [Flavobacteriaceae bacterium]|nr:methyltransferase [Flavobacteriaceae bacterium]